MVLEDLFHIRCVNHFSLSFLLLERWVESLYHSLVFFLYLFNFATMFTSKFFDCHLFIFNEFWFSHLHHSLMWTRQVFYFGLVICFHTFSLASEILSHFRDLLFVLLRLFLLGCKHLISFCGKLWPELFDLLFQLCDFFSEFILHKLLITVKLTLQLIKHLFVALLLCI